MLITMTPVSPARRQVHHPGEPQAGGGAAPADGRHERRSLALRGHQVQEERGLPGRD